MINYWWVTRPKRKLNSVPEVLFTFTKISLEEEWYGQRETHLSLEEALEETGLKRLGDRRDQTGGGGRTYAAWLKSLGLIFNQESTNKIQLTLAGEALLAGEPPVEIIKNQILKYQFPSSYTLSKGVDVSSRFKIRPFRFLLRILTEKRLYYYLTEEEIAKIVIIEAENETEKCYNYIVNRIIEYRNYGDACLEEDFAVKYKSSKGKVNYKEPFNHLLDIANTIANWLEYTQLAKRNEDRKIILLDEKLEEVSSILNNIPPFIDRPEEHEYFQRKFGLDLKHNKDTRNLSEAKSVTSMMIAELMVKKTFITKSLKRPIGKITKQLIYETAEHTGLNYSIVEETLMKHYPYGAIGSFMTEYFELAFRGRDDAVEFEKSTAELFRESFGFETKHVGSIGLTPDVWLYSNNDNYQAIIDNKAYRNYSINNDHHNRMVYNYIKDIENYSDSNTDLAFFSYIAGGFSKNIDQQILKISKETKVHGSAVSVFKLIKMLEKNQHERYNHSDIRNIFSIDRQIKLSDL